MAASLPGQCVKTTSVPLETLEGLQQSNSEEKHDRNENFLFLLIFLFELCKNVTFDRCVQKTVYYRIYNLRL